MSWTEERRFSSLDWRIPQASKFEALITWYETVEAPEQNRVFVLSHGLILPAGNHEFPGIALLVLT